VKPRRDGTNRSSWETEIREIGEKFAEEKGEK